MTTIYFHLDFDAFFASVEELYHPEANQKPIIVGGEGNAGVICAANYLAKSYGAKAGMPIFQAKKILPSNTLYLRPRHDLYSNISKKIFNYIKNNYCNDIYVYSIDECSLEFKTNNKNWAIEYLRKAHIIQDDIFKTFKLSSSIGIGKSSFIAKMASDYKKPYGITIVKNQEDFKNYFWNMDISKMFMIGKSTSKSLNKIGINTIGELANCKNLDLLKNVLNKNYLQYLYNAKGLEIVEHRNFEKQKSFSIKETFVSYVGQEDILIKIKQMINNLYRYISAVAAKVKRIDCEVEYKNKKIKKTIKLSIPIYKKEDITSLIYQLFDDIYLKNKDLIRSLHFCLSNIIYDDKKYQLEFSDLNKLDKNKKEDINWQAKITKIIDDNSNNDATKNIFLKKGKIHFSH